MSIYNNLTLSPENIHSLSELIKKSLYEDENFADYVNIQRVNNNDPIALVGAIQAVGKAGAGCDPEYEALAQDNELRRWELNPWNMALKICYTDIYGTMLQFALKQGTEIGQLDSTDLMTQVIFPAIDNALREAMWRIGWFGDKTADTISNGGSLTNGTDKTLFSVTDGLWKRIFAQATANAEQYTAITANTKTTYADQKNTMLAQGTATALVDKIIMDADSRVSGDSGSTLFLTKALADALTYDVKATYKEIMPWQTIFNGVKVAEYNGVKIASISIWDRIIKAYENTGTKLNKPYRALFANKENLMIGSPAQSPLSDIDVFFDKKERREYIYATGLIGSALREKEMFHVAY